MFIRIGHLIFPFFVRGKQSRITSYNVCYTKLLRIPAEYAEQAAEYREKLVETAVEADDDAMEAYLEGNEPDEATLKACIRKGAISMKFVPVLCGSAFKNKGVQPLLDAVVDYLPSPLDVPAIKGVLLA